MTRTRYNLKYGFQSKKRVVLNPIIVFEQKVYIFQLKNTNLKYSISSVTQFLMFISKECWLCLYPRGQEGEKGSSDFVPG